MGSSRSAVVVVVESVDHLSKTKHWIVRVPCEEVVVEVWIDLVVVNLCTLLRREGRSTGPGCRLR